VIRDQICWCGKEFKLNKKDTMNLLGGFELFCSEKCVLNYINHVKVKAPAIPRNPPKVSLDFEQYDTVTKAFYRSLYEVWFARCLKKNKIPFAYEPHSFYLDGKYYTPDFYIPDKELYIELKGLWRNVSKTKIKKVSEFVSIILLPSYFQSKLRKYKRKDDVVK
jgi:hypothetical protein